MWEVSTQWRLQLYWCLAPLFEMLLGVGRYVTNVLQQTKMIIYNHEFEWYIERVGHINLRVLHCLENIFASYIIPHHLYSTGRLNPFWWTTIIYPAWSVPWLLTGRPIDRFWPRDLSIKLEYFICDDIVQLSTYVRVLVLLKFDFVSPKRISLPKCCQNAAKSFWILWILDSMKWYKSHQCATSALRGDFNYICVWLP